MKVINEEIYNRVIKHLDTAYFLKSLSIERLENTIADCKTQVESVNLHESQQHDTKTISK
jgi:hypothetical protein